MGRAIGTEIKIGAKKAAVWGTAVQLGALDGILIRPSGFTKTRPNLLDDSLGQFWPSDSDPGEISAAAELSAYMRYAGLDLLIAMAMGGSAIGGAGPDYDHDYTLAESIDGKFVCVAMNNNVNIDELTSAKVTGFTIRFQVGQPLEIVFDLIASDRIFNSAVNTSGTMASLTVKEKGNRILSSHGVIRMNDQDGAALGVGDVIYPASFELSFKRKMTGVYGLGGSFDRIDEPSNDGVPTVSLKTEFPRYTNAGHFTDWETGQAKKLDMTFTGAALGGTNRSLLIEIPNLKYAGADLPIVEGIMRHPVEFNCLGCAAAPTGMAGLTTPFRMTLVNDDSVDPLA